MQSEWKKGCFDIFQKIKIKMQQSDFYRNIHYVHKFKAHRLFADEKWKMCSENETRAKTLIINKRWYHFSTK